MDFADMRTYPPEQLPGLIVLRPRMQDKIMVLDLIRRLLPSFTREPLVGHLWIADESSLRIRPEP
jgi:hypothetical protein